MFNGSIFFVFFREDLEEGEEPDQYWERTEGWWGTENVQDESVRSNPTTPPVREVDVKDEEGGHQLTW